MELCIHEMPKDWCATCNGDEKKFNDQSEQDWLTFEGLMKDLDNG